MEAKYLSDGKFAQLVISGSLFVLLVALKLFWPEQMAIIREPIDGLLEKNMDMTAAFSAVGRALSGEETAKMALDHVYQAVFGPVGFAEGTESSDDEKNTGDEGIPKQGFLKEDGSSVVIYTNDNIPKNVQLRQEVLGFDYQTPLAGTITSYFGYRAYPEEGEEDRFHYGLDIASEQENGISAFADGVVTVVGESSSYGKYLIISHENNCTTLYAHCQRIDVKSGQTVRKGEKIALVGRSGMATGPHLHFELQKEGVYLNPVYYVS